MKTSLRRAAQKYAAVAFLSLFLLPVSSLAQQPSVDTQDRGPWANASLSPDQRADLVLKEMTLDEKIALLHGVGMPTMTR